MVFKSRRMRWAGYVARFVEMRNACKILVGEAEGKRPLRIRGHGREYNIRIDFRKLGGGIWTGCN
jgi:hypothetical protein